MRFAILLLYTQVENPKAPQYVLLQSRKTVIGRHGDVVMDTTHGKEISKYHAIITYHHQKPSHGVWMISDNDSVNGTFVNNKKIYRKILNEGDEIVFGGGSGFLVGQSIESSEKAECKYKFFMRPPNVRFANVDPNEDIQDVENPATCSICYQELNTEEVLPCGHSFCLSCIHKWANVCVKNMTPCVCPLCRAPFSQSQLTPNEFILSKNELQVWSIEGMLRDLGVKNCKVIKAINIFKKWAKKHKNKFWEFFDIVKEDLNRKTVFLYLVEATPDYLFRASVDQLKQAIENFQLVLPKEEPSKDTLRLVLLKFIYEKLDPPQPRVKKTVNIIY